MIYYYGRVSTDHQENSAANQRQIFEGLAAAAGEPYEIVIDEDVSGSTPLSQRPLGRKMWDQLKAGDRLVVTKLDRGWRSSRDAAHCLDVLRHIGVRLQILDFPIDVSTDEGELMFLMFSNISQYENRQRGRRVKDIFAYRKRNGLPYACARPYGWQRDGDTWTPLQSERDIADMAYRLRREGLSCAGVATRLACRNVCKPVTKKKVSYYTPNNIRALLSARAAGYPIATQAQMQGSARAGKTF